MREKCQSKSLHQEGYKTLLTGCLPPSWQRGTWQRRSWDRRRIVYSVDSVWYPHFQSCTEKHAIYYRTASELREEYQ